MAKLFQKRSSSWLLAALCMAEQLWLCLFACAFLHIHHGDGCHRSPGPLLTVQTSICCYHKQNTHHDKCHNHNIPGLAKKLTDEEDDVRPSGTEMIFQSTFRQGNTLSAACKTASVISPIAAPIIKKYNMRC